MRTTVGRGWTVSDLFGVTLEVVRGRGWLPGGGILYSMNGDEEACRLGENLAFGIANLRFSPMFAALAASDAAFDFDGRA